MAVFAGGVLGMALFLRHVIEYLLSLARNSAAPKFYQCHSAVVCDLIGQSEGAFDKTADSLAVEC